MNALVSCPSICVYTRVDPISLCPNHSLRTVIGVPWMRQFIAKLCLNDRCSLDEAVYCEAMPECVRMRPVVVEPDHLAGLPYVIVGRLSVESKEPVFSGNHTFIQPDCHLHRYCLRYPGTRVPEKLAEEPGRIVLFPQLIGEDPVIRWISSDVKYFGISLENARES